MVDGAPPRGVRERRAVGLDSRMKPCVPSKPESVLSPSIGVPLWFF